MRCRRVVRLCSVRFNPGLVLIANVSVAGRRISQAKHPGTLPAIFQHQGWCVELGDCTELKPPLKPVSSNQSNHMAQLREVVRITRAATMGTSRQNLWRRLSVAKLAIKT